jgi:hypothetical protein
MGSSNSVVRGDRDSSPVVYFHRCLRRTQNSLDWDSWDLSDMATFLWEIIMVGVPGQRKRPWDELEASSKASKIVTTSSCVSGHGRGRMRRRNRSLSEQSTWSLKPSFDQRQVIVDF